MNIKYTSSASRKKGLNSGKTTPVSVPRKKITCIEMIITPKIMAYFWQFSFCIHKNIQVFIGKR